MSNCIPLVYMDEITYPCHNPDAGLDTLLVKETSEIHNVSRLHNHNPRHIIQEHVMILQSYIFFFFFFFFSIIDKCNPSFTFEKYLSDEFLPELFPQGIGLISEAHSSPIPCHCEVEQSSAQKCVIDKIT